ncbi:toll-interacting protein-like isoform X1 [Tachypleus tridentatus]|uniref:toll-interacting protein-like isoform X1 n=1 Tax=Tachypleus tridentatus TaxID=6853 RepID=UPI003FD60D62
MASQTPAENNSKVERNNEQKSQIMIGELPEDFLRISVSNQQQLAADEQAAIALQQQYCSGGFAPSNVTGRLSITVIEAKLNKNYGVTRMDPYVRLRVGHTIYETPTDYNGAKNPHWNKVFHCYLPTGVTSINVDVFDECAFTLDEKVAWCHINIPEVVFSGETVEDWFPLSGRQGEQKEGFINLAFSHTTLPAGPVSYQPVVVVPTPYYPSVVPYFPAGPAVAVPQYQQMYQERVPACQTRQPEQVTDEDVKQVQEMFPNMDKEVIKTVLESNRGNKDAAINALLTMSSES